MQNVEYQHIIERIKDRSVSPPTGMTLDNLNSWLTGYAHCMTDILKMLEEIQGQDNRR